MEATSTTEEAMPLDPAVEAWTSGLPRSAAGRWTALVVAILLALVFLGAGLSKLMGQEMNLENFDRWGYPSWFMYVVGVAETLAATLLLIPRTRFWGAAGIVLDMTGAVLTHMNSEEWSIIPGPGILLLLAAVLTALTRPPALRGPEGDMSLPSGHG